MDKKWIMWLNPTNIYSAIIYKLLLVSGAINMDKLEIAHHMRSLGGGTEQQMYHS